MLSQINVLPQSQNNMQPHQSASTLTAQAFPTNGKDVMQDLSGFYVKQKPQYLENLTGCEQSNVYRVYKRGTNNKHSSSVLNTQDFAKGKLFKCKEKSGFCSRNCVANICRAFEMIVEVYVFSNGQKIKKPFLHFHRDYTCTCFCCKRPILAVEYIEDGGKELLGYVHCPFSCCGLEIDIHEGGSKTPKYKVSGFCCQLGLFLKMPCGPCKEVTFKIRDSSNTIIGTMKKTWTGIVKDVVTNSDNFIIDFPHTLDWKDKCLMLADVILYDFMYFEENNKNKEENLLGNFANHL